MQVNDLASVDPNVDYTKILPIQQKRTIAFINHFVMNTVSFLNNFAQSCESRLMEFEYKLQDVEASLLILESQLSSISHLDSDENVTKPETSTQQSEPVKPTDLDLPEVKDQETEKTVNDPNLQRFFKMLQFGVPVDAVRLKMQLEGIDPSILDTSNLTKKSAEETSNHNLET